MKRHSSIIALLLCVWLPLANLAQAAPSAKATEGFTPAGFARGGAAGSFPLSGFDHINLPNGKLRLSIPVLTIGGRGSASVTLYVNIEKHWGVERHSTLVSCGPSQNCTYTYQYSIDGTDWIQQSRSFSPGAMRIRQVGRDDVYCQNYPERFDLMLSRLTFIHSDGSETEFVDATYNGEPKGLGASCAVGQSRGTVFYSTDGSAMTFIGDNPVIDTTLYTSTRTGVTGNLMMKDGTKYRIVDGNIAYIRDRDGNRIDFGYADSSTNLISITDQLKRVYALTWSGNDVTLSYKGYQGASRTISTSTDGNNWLIAGQSSLTHSTAFPNLTPQLYGSTGIGPGGPTHVYLPDNRFYRIWYNNYGEVARVDMPTGGRYDYEWGAGYGADSQGLYNSAGVYRRVTKKKVYTDAGTTLVEEVNYSGAGATDQVIVDRVMPGTSTVLAREKHRFFGNPTSQMTYHNDPVSYAPWNDNLEDWAEYYSGPSTLLRTVDNDWEPRVTYTWGLRTASFDPRLIRVTTKLNDVTPNLVKKEEFTYSNDAYNNITVKKEFDWGSGSPPATEARKTETSYLTTNPNQGGTNYATTNSIHIRNLPVQASIYDSGGTERARTVFDYDKYTDYALQDCSGIVGRESGFGTGYVTRGNLTHATVYTALGGSPASIVAKSKFDIAGNAVKAVDGRGNATDFDFTDNFGGPNGNATMHSQPTELAVGEKAFAWPSLVTNALTHETRVQYDYYLGKAVDSADPNNVVNTLYYNDALERPTKTILANGASAQTETVVTYDDGNKKVTTARDQNAVADGRLTGIAKYDGLGRTSRKIVYDGTNYLTTVTEYDEFGRAKRTSNPFSGSTDSTAAPSGGWNTATYDALGRITQSQSPDSATVTLTYSGRETTLQDQAGRKRKLISDGLGRVTEVIEDPTGTPISTTYQVNAFDKLVKSTQVDGAVTQNRYWLYDAAGRLIAARYPEHTATPYSITDTLTSNNSWSQKWLHDENGNVTDSADPRSVSVNGVPYEKLLVNCCHIGSCGDA